MYLTEKIDIDQHIWFWNHQTIHTRVPNAPECTCPKNPEKSSYICLLILKGAEVQALTSAHMSPQTINIHIPQWWWHCVIVSVNMEKQFNNFTPKYLSFMKQICQNRITNVCLEFKSSTTRWNHNTNSNKPHVSTGNTEKCI